MKNSDRAGLLSAPQNMTLWKRIQASCPMWVYLVGLTIFLPFAYFAASGLPALIFIMGLPLIWQLKSIRHFLVPAALTGAILLLAFVRSDFIIMIMQGKSVQDAYKASNHYFLAPMAMWFIAWAMICAARNMPGGRALRIVTWFAYIGLALTALQLLDTASAMGVRNALNLSFFHGKRPEMVVVRGSDANFLLMMLFWPLCLIFNHRGWLAPVIAMTIALIGIAIVADTNAQILALGGSVLVFFVVRYWPHWLASRRITPERVFAVLAGFSVLIFPALILNMVSRGLGYSIKAHMPPSWAARIDIWSFTVERCLEKPIWGWGYEAARLFEPDIPEHPHNMSMQAWLELGIPGLVLLALLWGAIFWLMMSRSDGLERKKAHRDRLTEIGTPGQAVETMGLEERVRPYFIATVTVLFIINSVSYGMWRLWLYCAGALAAALLLLIVRAIKEDIRLHNLL